MAPKSTAERCKKYCQKHKEVYREKDALRKRNYRQKIKANPIVNKERLRVQRQQEHQQDELTENEKEWLKNLLDKPDITYVTPGRKDHRYVGKVDGKSQYVQKRYLMWTLSDLLNIANGSSLIKNESSFEFSFGKKIKFHQLYEYIKSNREYVYNRDIP